MRTIDNHVDFLALGDGAAYFGNAETTSELTDHRLSELGLSEHREYKERLARGFGYDDRHRELLDALQRGQRQRRNRVGGYWIAEADPLAAHHAITKSVPADAIEWAVIATDGAYKPMRHLGLDNWQSVASFTDMQLHDLLNRCTEWENTVDPTGKLLPRAKISDDKTLAAVTFG